MKELFLDLVTGVLMGMCFVIFCFFIASLSSSVYSKDLSKSNSVTPQRHCGFIVPKFCLASQAVQETSASISAMQTRLYSLYEGMTRQNKSAMANMSGGTIRPRVNPLTIISQVMANLKNSKLIGGNHA
ncbi:hypothetical protein [Acinetobacter sp. YH12200]|uniref:hypothetical protein n=1 Tax=Acinetobacter sp. YH12200 TaxID=2601139 RepID=UPI00211F3B0A|nr:hypothetical protein [Acinetobacter sp. YH12200]